MALVASFDLECEQIDVNTAFLNSKLDRSDIYIYLPKGYKEQGKIARLLKALYGLKQSPRLWYEELRSHLVSIDYLPIASDPCVFIKKATGSIIIVYVDDLILITKSMEQMHELKKLILDKYKCRDLGAINFYLGVRVIRDRPNRSLKLVQDAYIDKILRDYKMENCLPRKTPLPVSALNFKPRDPQDRADEQFTKRYQSIVGKLLYPTNWTRADSAWAVGLLCRFLSNPSQAHLDGAYHVLQYYSGTKNLGIEFKAPPNQRLDVDLFVQARFYGLNFHGYSDAAFADAADRKSTSGYVFKLAGGTISHKSGKQSILTTSTTEAEYVAMTYAAKEATWLRRLLQDLNYGGSDLLPVRLFGDNLPSINLTKSDAHHSRTKHIDLYYHYIREEVQAGRIQLQHVPTQDMVADGLTKPLHAPAMQRFIKQLGLVPCH